MKKNRPLNIFLLSLFCLNSQIGKAQNNIFFNKGIFKVYDNTIISSYSDFQNSPTGQVFNDGVSYYFGNFTNDGLFDFSKNAKDSKVLFISNTQINKKIQGNSLINLKDIVFDNRQNKNYFDLKANIDIWGEVDFKNGIIQVDSTLNPITKLSHGIVSFMPNAKYKGAKSNSFIDGQVEKVGDNDFVFPIGNKDQYRPIMISAPKNIKNTITTRYISKDNIFFNTHSQKADMIDKINSTEYWIIEKSNNINEDIILTLTWDTKLVVPELLDNPEKNLQIIHWNVDKKQWESIGGIVDVNNKSVSSPISLDQSGYFTLGTTKRNMSLSDQVIIYNLVTANQDGKNDYFLIENINKYPENKLQIFNRWAIKVYQTTNYDSQGNVFNGYPNTSGSSNKKLPSGTYYYLLTYQVKNKKENYTVKKTGYIHLETH